MFRSKKQDIEFKLSPYIVDLRTRKPKKGHRFFAASRKWLFSLCLLIPGTLLFLLFFHGQANVIQFYPQSCLGDWQNPNLAQTDEGGDINETNAAFLKAGTKGQLFCGGFQGEIPDNTVPLKAKLKISLFIKPIDAETKESQSGPLSFRSFWLSLVKAEEEPSASESNNTDFQNTQTNASSSSLLNNSLDTSSTDTSSTSQTNLESEVSTASGEVLGEATSSVSIDKTQVSESVSSSTSTDNSLTSATTETSTPTTSETSTLTANETSTSTSTTETSTSTTTENSTPTTNETSTLTANETSTPTTTENNFTTGGTSIDSSASATETTTPGSEATKESEVALLEIFYSLDGVNYESLGQVTNLNWHSWEREFNLSDWSDINNLQIKVERLNTEAPYDLYLGALWLEVFYQSTEESEETIVNEEPPPEQNLTLETDPLGSLNPFVLDLTVNQTSTSPKNSDENLNCEVKPFSQEVSINQSARYEVILSAGLANQNWRLNSTKIPAGFEAKISQRPDDSSVLDLEITPRKNALKASYSFGLFFGIDGKPSAICQFNLLVK